LARLAADFLAKAAERRLATPGAGGFLGFPLVFGWVPRFVRDPVLGFAPAGFDPARAAACFPAFPACFRAFFPTIPAPWIPDGMSWREIYVTHTLLNSPMSFEYWFT
jgi:hypothetical protein